MNVYLGELYKEVEYIQSSGNQYIDTGYLPSNNTKIEMSMGGWNQTGTYNDLFGARESWGSNGKGFLLGHNGTNGDYYSMFNANKSGASMPGFSFIDGNTHNIVMSQNGIYQDGTQKVTFSTVTFTSPVNLLLFALNDNGTTGEYGYFKLYYCKIWDSGTLVRDFIPCYRVSDNVIGLFDKVENKFYTNAGTGSFTKGSDVKVFQPELKNAYIGEVYEYSYDFRNKTTTQVTNDGWSTVGDVRSWSVDSNGVHIVGYGGNLIKTIGNSYFQNARKITIKSHVNIQTYATRNSILGISGSSQTNDSGYNMDTRQSFRKIKFNGASVNQTNASIPYGQYDTKTVFDLVNKTATFSLSGYADTTASLTDSAITAVKNNVTSLQIGFYNDSNSNTASYYRDIHLLIEY